MSHIHADHIGNLPYFSGATMLIHEAEYSTVSAATTEMENLGFDTSLYTAVEAHQPVHTFQENYDVFGDGSVVLLPAPGHSAGHSVNWVDLPETGPVILGGDLYFTQQDHENYVVPGRTLDKRQLVRSFALVDDLLEQTGAQLWLNHDGEQLKQMTYVPAFYK
jgi:glyoxylase-like metal-dependent hydrolase (beta-lactamase superfamily II)